ncbi:hypothetical protein B484DRAFT_389048, partial [Ochromonadaceae sp. CCMP2298]
MDQDSQIKKYSGALERASWFIVLLGMLSEISTDHAFPSYNIALGFWGAYSAFSKHGRATFGFISFTFFSLILDVVFCSNNRHSSSMFKFCLTMFIFCLFVKMYALYQASMFFTSIGGAYSLDSSNMTSSMYESLRGSTSMHGQGQGQGQGGQGAGHEEESGGYYPPQSNSQGEGVGSGLNNSETSS